MSDATGEKPYLLSAQREYQRLLEKGKDGTDSWKLKERANHAVKDILRILLADGRERHVYEFTEEFPDGGFARGFLLALKQPEQCQIGEACQSSCFNPRDSHAYCLAPPTVVRIGDIDWDNPSPVVPKPQIYLFRPVRYANGQDKYTVWERYE